LKDAARDAKSDADRERQVVNERATDKEIEREHAHSRR